MFCLNLKNWLFLVDFEARIKNRTAMKDEGEKIRVCIVIKNVLNIPKLSSFFIQHARLLKCIPLNFMWAQWYKIKITIFHKICVANLQCHNRIFFIFKFYVYCKHQFLAKLIYILLFSKKNRSLKWYNFWGQTMTSQFTHIKV